ncbi:DUF1918 domain-containing protein [Parafrankia elaeagni]|uniref:DUF1918 domain-containing protein n=1 Tax=Parafrankia elaeagni TaxID=222534 RepID=UPI00035EF050|nr:DUF1918 domain-containing protein [Parafrankia elaeagni]
MYASVGDRFVVHGRTVGDPERHGSIIEVRGTGGGPPFMVRWDDGHEGLFFPGADSTIELRPAREHVTV